jgi:hypothetical protein
VDKTEFLRLAHLYYAIAIIHRFQQDYRPLTLTEIEHAYTNDTLFGTEFSYFPRANLMVRAVNFLVLQGAVNIIPDPFAPQILVQSKDYHDVFRKLTGDTYSPFYNYSLTNNSDHWIKEALINVERQYVTLGIQESDFDVPADQQWEPLALERDDPQLDTAIRRIDETIEQVRGDNGYAATVPEERSFVLESLSTVSAKLNAAPSVSLSYLKRYAWEPLSILVRRFGPAALGLVATAAKEAIKEWLKKKGIVLLDDL